MPYHMYKILSFSGLFVSVGLGARRPQLLLL